MTKYVIKRLVLGVATVFIIMTMLFVLIKMLPNTVEPNLLKTDIALKQMYEAWGYNEPILTQYGIFLKNVFTDWNWGVCTTTGTYLMPVTEYIAGKLPYTMYLNVVSILFAVPLGIILGIVAAVFKNRWQDQALNVFIMIFISVPAFIYAFVLQYFVGYKLGWLPLILEAGNNFFSWSMIKSAIMPILALSFGTIAGNMRTIRAELTETLTSDYMLLARTKGLSYSRATVRHALRNSLVPMMPGFLADVIYIISGSLIIEKIFGVPGIGSVYLASINSRDYNVFMALSMFYIVINMFSGILFDLSYGFIDPRIRMGGGKNNEL